MNRRAFSASKAIVTFSRWAADSVVDDYGIPAAKVHVIRPGVDLRHFRPRPVERPPGPVRILFVGGDFVRKGGDDLLEAVRYLGDSAELDLVTASAPPSPPGSPRIRVHMGLDHSSEQLFDLYRRADVFVLPSRGECYGHVICEALASGLPVVACDVGAVRELVLDGYNGLLVPPGSPARLAEAIRMLVEQPELWRIFGERGLRMAERDHDAARNAGTIFDLMRTLSDRRLAQPGAAGDDHAEMEVP